MVDFTGLVSSNIANASYADETHVLTVEFSNGSRYTYRGVPLDVAQGLADAGSPGQYLNDSIKGVYSYSRVG